MKTKKTEFKQKVGIWAIPKSSYQIEQNPDDEPFDFQVRTDKPWINGAVQVHEEEISMTVPEGIDITMKAIETLNAAKVELQASLNSQIAEINGQISNLLRLECIPDEPESFYGEPICNECRSAPCICLNELDDFDDDIPF